MITSQEILHRLDSLWSMARCSYTYTGGKRGVCPECHRLYMSIWVVKYNAAVTKVKV